MNNNVQKSVNSLSERAPQLAALHLRMARFQAAMAQLAANDALILKAQEESAVEAARLKRELEDIKTDLDNIEGQLVLPRAQGNVAFDQARPAFWQGEYTN